MFCQLDLEQSSHGGDVLGAQLLADVARLRFIDLGAAVRHPDVVPAQGCVSRRNQRHLTPQYSMLDREQDRLAGNRVVVDVFQTPRFLASTVQNVLPTPRLDAFNSWHSLLT